jgi:hypothetical protein
MLQNIQNKNKKAYWEQQALSKTYHVHTQQNCSGVFTLATSFCCMLLCSFLNNFDANVYFLD